LAPTPPQVKARLGATASSACNDGAAEAAQLGAPSTTSLCVPPDALGASAVVCVTVHVVVSAHALSPVAAGTPPRVLGTVVSVVTMRIHASRAGSVPTSWQLAASVCSRTTVKVTGEPETARPFSRTLSS
jgi:hypothetical protein